MTIGKDKDPSIKVKMHQTFCLNFYHYLPYICWVNVIYLTCIVFLKSPWWLVCIFCTPIPPKKLQKLNIRKCFMVHQKFWRIFHDPSIYDWSISWPSPKPSSLHSYILNVWSLKQFLPCLEFIGRKYDFAICIRGQTLDRQHWNL